MNIGDLIMRVLINDKAFDADLQKTAQKSGDKAGKTLGARMSAGLKDPFKGGKGDLLGMLGIGAGLGIATVAIGKLVDVMGDAVSAALADEESQNRLRASLKANVPEWDGNTDAIEKNIKAAQRLGFEDETLRDSMTVLVGATHDVAKAEDIMSTAMDLARFKGIDLKTASEALIKVEGGVYRSLKQLGIKLKDNATSTEALAAVQAVATGQAEAFAESNQGKLLASQIRVGEALENLGTRLMPLFVTGVEAGAEVVESFALALDALSGKFPETTQDSIDFINTMLQFSPMKDLVSRSLEEVQASLDETGREGKRGLGVIESSLEDVGEEAGRTADDVDDAAKRMDVSVKEWRDNLLGYARDVVDKAYQVIEDKAELTAATVESTELRKVIATGNATREQKAKYQELGETQAKLVLSLAANGVTAGKEVNAAMNDIRNRLKTATGQERKALLATLAVLKTLAAQAKITAGQIRAANALIGANLGGLTGGGRGRAHGGPVSAGQAYVVGERRAEVFVPRVDGTIVPRVPTDWHGQAAGTVTYNIPVTVLGALPIRTAADLAIEMQKIGELGLLPSATVAPRYARRTTGWGSDR